MKKLGKPISTADNSASSPGVYQSLLPASSMMLKAVRCGIIHYNNPTYTSVVLKIYGNRNSAPGKLLATSTNSVLKATIAPAQNHAVSEVGFEFEPEVALRAGDTYWLALFINGAYVGDSTTHLAWESSWPAPVNRTGVTVNQAQADNMPLLVSSFGDII